MVYTGRPSGGCARCKQRKKRCDRASPGSPQCKQCMNLGLPCPGVPDELDLVFRNRFSSDEQTSFDSTAARRSRKFAVQDDDKTLSLARLERTLEAGLPKIAPNVPVDWLDTATTYFGNTHLRSDLPTRRLNPWLGLESRYFMAPEPGTGLYHAVTALATLTMATDLRSPELAEIATRPYGKALRAINSALADRSQATRNDIAVGIFVLNSYELKHRDVNRRRRYQTHTNGLKELIVMRGRKQLADVESLYVFRALRVHMIYNFMLRGEALTSEADETIWTDDSPYNATPVDDLCAVAARIPQLRAQVKRICISQSNASSNNIVKDAFEIEGRLGRWLEKWQDHLNHEVVFKMEDDPDLWQDRAHIFTDLSISALVNHYYLFRLFVLDALLKGLEHPIYTSDDVTAKSGEIVQEIQDLIDKICYSIPFMTGQVRGKNLNRPWGNNQRWIYTSHAEATWILLPIAIAAQQDKISTAQKAWLIQQLIRLNADFGLWNASSMPFGLGQQLSVLPTNSSNIY